MARPSANHDDDSAWRELNRSEVANDRAHSLSLTPAQRLSEGQALSKQALSLLVASIEAGHAPERSLWT